MPEPQEPFIGEDGKAYSAGPITIAAPKPVTGTLSGSLGPGMLVFTVGGREALFFHPDGRVTSDPTLKPDAAAQAVVNALMVPGWLPYAAAFAWRPIASAPKDGTLIDLWHGGRAADCKWGTYYRADATHPKPVTFTGWVYYHEAWGEWVELSHEHPEEITHWQPIPPPPEGT